MAEHTQIPWKALAEKYCAFVSVIAVREKGTDQDNRIASVDGNVSLEEQRANAELICRAVNNHHKLVNCCTELRIALACCFRIAVKSDGAVGSMMSDIDEELERCNVASGVDTRADEALAEATK